MTDRKDVFPVAAYRRSAFELPPMPSLAYALAWCDHILDRFAGGYLVGIPCFSDPTICDVRTRRHFSRCWQCGRESRRLWFYAGRLLLCRSCATSRVRVGEMLRLEEAA